MRACVFVLRPNYNHNQAKRVYWSIHIAGVKTQFPDFFHVCQTLFLKIKVSEIGLHSEFGDRWERGKAWFKIGNSFLGTRLRKKVHNFFFLKNATNFLFKLIRWPSLKSRNLISYNKKTFIRDVPFATQRNVSPNLLLFALVDRDFLPAIQEICSGWPETVKNHNKYFHLSSGWRQAEIRIPPVAPWIRGGAMYTMLLFPPLSGKARWRQGQTYPPFTLISDVRKPASYTGAQSMEKESFSPSSSKCGT